MAKSVEAPRRSGKAWSSDPALVLRTWNSSIDTDLSRVVEAPSGLTYLSSSSGLMGLPLTGTALDPAGSEGLLVGRGWAYCIRSSKLRLIVPSAVPSVPGPGPPGTLSIGERALTPDWPDWEDSGV